MPRSFVPSNLSVKSGMTRAMVLWRNVGIRRFSIRSEEDGNWPKWLVERLEKHTVRSRSVADPGLARPGTKRGRVLTWVHNNYPVAATIPFVL